MSRFWTYDGKIVRELSANWPNAVVEYWNGDRVVVHGSQLDPPISKFEDYDVIDRWPVRT